MRKCEVDKIGIDLPCMRKAPHFLKIVSKHLGDKGKVKIWLCEKHHEALRDQEYVKDLLNPDEQPNSEIVESDRFKGRLSL